MPRLSDSKTEKVAGIIKSTHNSRIKDLLVIGCGSGLEAAILAEELNAQVTGIDAKGEFDRRAEKIADLRIGDAMDLRYADEAFDFVFSYHALEHIADPQQCLREIRRVLKEGGGFWIGTPNRTRLVGYIGAKEGSLKDKLVWNIADWRAQATGRFKNELGAHAGFSSDELFGMLSDTFSEVHDQTALYYRTIYQGSSYRSLFRLIEGSKLSQFLYPSVYFSGTK